MRVLLVEDKQEIRRQLLDTWHKVGIRLFVAEDTLTAQSYLEREEFDAILIDLNLDDSDVGFSGIPFGANVRAGFDDLLIVMYSAKIEHGQEPSFKHIDDCYQAGADKVLARSYLTTKTPLTIRKNLEDWRAARLSDNRDSIKLTHSDDLRMRAVIERLGDVSILKGILKKILPDASSYSIEVVSGGFSGAILLRTTGEKVANTGASARNIVKIDKSDFSLDRELKSKPFQGTHLDSVSVAPRMERVVHVHDWAAFSVRDVGESVSLESFLLVQRVNQRNRKLLKEYVEQLLNRNAAESVEQSIDNGAFAFDVRNTFLQEIVDAIDTVGKFCNVLRPKKAWVEATDSLRQFVDGIASGYYGMAGRTVHVAALHGDFHCRNVLLTAEDFRPLLIDFGRSAVYPRLFDYSCLEADLVMRVLDSDTGKFWDPKQVSTWWSEVAETFPLGAEPLENRTLINCLRTAMHDSLQNDLTSVTKQEYTDALLFQILRYLRFPNISIAKKALGVRWAAQLAKGIGL